jgi:nitrite reductase (NO-forming)
VSAAAGAGISLRRGPGRPAASASPRPSDLLVAFFAPAVTWLAAAAVAGLVAAGGGAADARWLALHLAFVGGISQLVVGAAQFFVCAFLATDPPGRREVRLQLALWNGGAAAIAVGVPLEIAALTGAGGALVIAGLAAFARSLRAMGRRSLQHAPWAARWYLTGAAWLAVGAALGPLLAAGTPWSHGSLLAAHLTVNIGGWFGSAIVGTLHTFYPSLTGTRLAHPRLQPPAFAAWTAGIGLAAAGAAFDVQAAAVAGWTLLLAAAALLGTNLAASARSAERRPPAARIVAAGQALLAAALVAALAVTAADGASAALTGPDRALVFVLAVAGWVGLTVAGSLLHLLALMAHVRRLALGGGRPPASERVALAGACVVVCGLLGAAVVHLTGAGDPAAAVARAVAAAGYAALGARIAVLAIRAVRAAPLRI